MKRSASIWICVLGLIISKPAMNQDIQLNLKKMSASIQTGISEPSTMDTLIMGAQVYHPHYKVFPSWSELGNMGLPAIPNRYTGIGSPSSPYLFNSYLFYLDDPDQISFFDAKTPYSEIRYNSGGTGDKNGQNLGFLYTRNFKEEVNLVGFFDFISSNGHYKNQSTTESTLGLTLAIEKSRYRHYSSLERIQFKLQENGGVVDDNQVIGNDYPELITVNLLKAGSKTSIMRLRGWQYLDILAPPHSDTTDSISVIRTPNPRRPILIHRYNYSTAKRIYKDEPGEELFYTNIFLDSVSTLDSLQHFGFVNDLNARIHGVSPDSANWVIEAGIHHELLHSYSRDNPICKQRLGIGGLTEYEGKKFYMKAQGVFIFTGYGAGDYNIGLRAGLVHPGNYGGPVFNISSKGLSADLFLQNLVSNHFQWTNDFSRQKEQRVGLSWEIPDWEMVVEVNSYLISNWNYFDTLAKPAQKKDAAFLTSARISKMFQAGPFRSQNSVFLNYTAADEIPLPMVVASSSTYMHHDIHFPKTQGLLQLEYGFDIRYTSAYKGYAYMPATGVFYLQNQQILGNYPFLDMFVVMRVKRTRFFIKWDHVNSGFMGDNIFPVLHYPVKQRYLKYGVFWYFYD